MRADGDFNASRGSAHPAAADVPALREAELGKHEEQIAEWVGGIGPIWVFADLHLFVGVMSRGREAVFRVLGFAVVGTRVDRRYF